MNSSASTDDEYPYSSTSARAAANSSFIPRPLLSVTWWKRIVGLAAVIAGAVVIAIAGLCVEVYRSLSRESLVRKLEEPAGCSVTYSHEYPYQKDSLPPSLRERVGRHAFADVLAYSQVDWSRERSNLSPDQVDFICRACRQFPRLRSFHVVSNHFRCEQIAKWPSLRTLEELSVASTRLTDEDLAIIAKMERLKDLKLASATISAKGIAELAKLPRLESVTFYAVEFIGSSERPAGGFPALRHVMMEHCPKIGDDAILSFGALPRLEEAILLTTSVGDGSVDRLVAGGTLEKLILKDSRITDDGLRCLQKCTKPLFLNLQGTAVTDDGLGTLAGKEIQGLVLDNTAITDDGLMALGSLHGLSFLSLDGTKVSGAGLSGLDSTERINWIRLEGASVTREGLSVLAKLNVDQLCLVRTPLTDSDLMLFANSDSIASIDGKETKITADGVRAFYEARKRRLASAGRHETLLVVSEFPGIVEQYLPESEAWRIADAFPP